MNIDLTKMKTSWWENEDGKMIDSVAAEKEGGYFHTCHPLKVIHKIYDYSYHPKNFIIKFLCRNKKIYEFLSKRKEKTYEELICFSTDYSLDQNAQDCIIAMVNSGDYTLTEAMWVFYHSCKRCTNALLYKYLNGKKGYEEYSNEWKIIHSKCDFCRGE